MGPHRCTEGRKLEQLPGFHRFWSGQVVNELFGRLCWWATTCSVRRRWRLSAGTGIGKSWCANNRHDWLSGGEKRNGARLIMFGRFCLALNTEPAAPVSWVPGQRFSPAPNPTRWRLIGLGIGLTTRLGGKRVERGGFAVML